MNSTRIVISLLLVSSLLVGCSPRNPSPQAASIPLPPTPSQGTPIFYSRTLPKSVSSLMPKGARSLFWGTLPLQTNRTPLSVHFFQLKPRQFEGEQTHFFGLDLFTVRSGKEVKCVRQNRFLCTSTFGLQGKIVNMELIWLDKAKHLPILKFSVMSKGDYGSYGDEVAVTFVAGWHRPPVVQTWASGSWFFSDSIGEGNDWKHRDSKGFLEIVLFVSIPAPDNPHRIEWWRWQGNKFVRVKTQILSPPINLTKIKAV